MLLVDSFGQDPAIDWPQQKTKRFTFALPRSAVAVLYFDGTGATVDINGRAMDVRTDVLAQELLLPSSALRAGANVLSFKAATGQLEWRVENLWLYALELKRGEEACPRSSRRAA